MEIKKAVFALTGIALFFAPSLFAQSAKKELLPQGQLFLSSGNLSPLTEERPIRAYGLLGFGGGTQIFKGQTEFDIQTEQIAAAADFDGGDSIISIGYFKTSVKRDTTIDQVALSLEEETTRVGGRYTAPWSESLVIAVEIMSVGEDLTISASDATSAAGASVDFQYFDFVFGARADFTESIAAGFTISPAVSEDKGYDGALAGTLARTGHGFRFNGGAAYHAEGYALGADFAVEGENTDSNSAAVARLIFSGEYLLTDNLAVAAVLEVFQRDELVDQGQFLIPESEGGVLTLRMRKNMGRAVVGLVLRNVQQTASDFGDDQADSSRFDSLSLTSLSGTVAVDF